MIKDIIWAYRMFKAKRFRAKACFSKRVAFDSMLKPHVGTDAMLKISYPDAAYHAKGEDFKRAYEHAR